MSNKVITAISNWYKEEKQHSRRNTDFKGYGKASQVKLPEKKVFK